jgi:predicted membrane metal-binding protein
MYTPMFVRPVRTGLSSTALVLGIISALLMFMPLAGMFALFALFFGAFIGIAAVTCGHLALSSVKREPHLYGGGARAVWGLMLGYIATIFLSLPLLVGFIGMFS